MMQHTCLVCACDMLAGCSGHRHVPIAPTRQQQLAPWPAWSDSLLVNHNTVSLNKKPLHCGSIVYSQTEFALSLML